MAVQSLSTSGITNFARYKSMLVGNDVYIPPDPSSFDLLQSIVMPSAATSVTFSSLGDYAANYKHLQLRVTLRSTRPDTDSYVYLQFNNDQGSNYHSHYLRGTGSAVGVGNFSTPYPSGIVDLGSCPAATAPSDSYGASVIDILTPFDTNKYTTTKSFNGQAASSYSRLSFSSGVWKNTNSITSLTIRDVFSSLVAGCSLSLYGVK